MSRRKISGLKPFPFEADFSPGRSDPDAQTAEISLRDLARLGAELRAEGANGAQARLDADAVARLETAATRLENALGDLALLAERLELLAEDGWLPGDLAQSVRMATMRVSDGQGDLFAIRDVVAPPDPQT